MGIYTDSNGYRDNDGEEIEVNLEELMEQFFYDDHYNDSDEEKAELFESAEMTLLEKKNISSKKTMIRLNKNDDIIVTIKENGETLIELEEAIVEIPKPWSHSIENLFEERFTATEVKEMIIEYNNRLTAI